MPATNAPRDYYVEAVLDVFFPEGLEYINVVDEAIKSGRARLVVGRDTFGNPIHAPTGAAE